LDAQKAALLVGLGADAGNLKNLRTRAKAASHCVADNVQAVRSVMPATNGAASTTKCSDPRNLVDATFDHGLERLLKLALVNVMLILAHADGFGIDLTARRVVLEAAGDGDGAHGEIEIGNSCRARPRRSRRLRRTH